MTTIPSRLARITKMSRTPEEARVKVIQLYRDWYRAAPEVVSMYALNVTVPYFRQRIRAKFEENRHITDIRIIDHLAHKGRLEYQETVNYWKQNDHVLGTLIGPTGRPQQTFLQKFYEGRDENQVLPAATGIVNHVP